jgi:hypothetical protein
MKDAGAQPVRESCPNEPMRSPVQIAALLAVPAARWQANFFFAEAG